MNAVVVIFSLSAGFCAGILGSYWWIGNYRDDLLRRIRALEREVHDDTHEHWLDGVQKGARDFNWPGKSYGGSD